MKRSILWQLAYTGVFFFIPACICHAQNPQAVDSLRKEIQHHTNKDTLLVKMFLNYANAIVFENTDSAMKYTAAALQLSQKQQWQRGIAAGLRQKGLVYYYQSDFLNAMNYSQNALLAGKILHDKLFDASVYSNIANIYADLGQNDKALNFYNKLLDVSKKIKNKQFEIIALSNMGVIYMDQNDYIKGFAYFRKGFVAARNINNLNVAAACLSNIGMLFKKEKEYDSARIYLEESIDMSKKTDNKNTEASALTELAEVYMGLHEFNKAEKYSHQSLIIANEINHIEWQRDAYKTLSNAYDKENKTAKALAAYKSYMALYDSMLNDKKRDEITRLGVQYEFDRRQDSIKVVNDKEKALAKAAIEKQHVINNSLLAGSGLLLLTGIAGFALYKRNSDTKTKQKEAELKAEVTETEMKALRAQMNPHFIFNSLNSIADYIDKNQTALASGYTVKFAKLMRLVLENSEHKQVSLADDLKALELYMQLESLRLTNKFEYEIKVDKRIDTENTLVPPLILQPFVENSIWHGMANKEGKGKIVIYIQQENNMLRCSVEDDGGGLKNEPAGEAKKSLGMRITGARIDIINKLKNANASVNVYNKERGVKAEVNLPLELGF